MSIHDPWLDTYIDVTYLGIQLSMTPAISGDLQGVNEDAEGALSLTMTISATPPGTNVLIDASDALSMEPTLQGEQVHESPRTHWVGWSKIGEVSFELDETNDAGFMPMAWEGYVLALKRLENNAVAYGSNGISLLIPTPTPSPTFGRKEVLRRVGIKSKNAVGGDDNVHFFIDRNGSLWTLTMQGVTRLDYSEFLNDLSNPQIFWDHELSRLLISDATKGYILTKEGLGGGYGNLRGYVRAFGEVLVSSGGGGITRPQPYFISNILDLSQRGTKTLTSVHMSTDTPERFELAYDFRFLQGAAWESTPWIPFNTWGVAFLRVVGLEFRVKIRAIEDTTDVGWDAFFDYLHINIQYTDQRFKRGMGATGRPDNREAVIR